MKKALKTLLAMAGLMAACASPVRGTGIVNATEIGGNVVFAGGGTFNLTDLTLQSGFALTGAGILPSSSFLAVGANPNTLLPIDVYRSIVSPGAFGAGGSTSANLGLGDRFGVVGIFSGSELFVPDGYISGTLLSASNTYSGMTFASLGLTPGSYTWSWGSGANADSFILNIGGAPAGVPESGSTAFSMLLGLGALALLGRSGRWMRAR